MRTERAVKYLKASTALCSVLFAWGCSGGGHSGGASQVQPKSVAATTSPTTSGTTPGTTPGSSTPGALRPTRLAPPPTTPIPPPTSTTPPPSSTTPPPSSSPPPPPAAAGTFSGAIPLGYVLADPASAPTDITAEFSLDGGTSWYYCSQGTGGDGMTALTTSPAGISHTFVWDTVTDLGAALDSGVIVAIIPTGKPAGITSPFNVDDRTAKPVTPPPATTTLPASSVVADRGPYLTATTQTGTTIAWRTTTPTNTVVQYSTGGAAPLTAGNSAASETLHAVTITGLTAATTYNYVVVCASGTVGQASTFSTAADSSALTFSCVAMGDTGQGTSAQQAVASLVAADSFDFMLHCGDVIYPSGADAGYDTFFFPQYGPFINSKTIFPAVGNHDYETANGQPYADVFHTLANNPAQSPMYYSFTWGNAKFVSIDTNNLFTAAGPATQWLTSELASNTSRWLVVFMHQPLYSEDTTHGDNTTLQAVLQPIFEQYKIDLAICGHAHIYERTAPIKRYSTDPTYKGWVQIITGGGGAALYGLNTSSAVTPVYEESVNHYTKLTFTQNELQVKVVRQDGTVAESVVIPHN